MFQAALYGRIGKDSDQRQTKNGNAMSTTSLAVDATGFNDETQHTLWIRVTAFNRLADQLAKHQKGDLISVSGAISQNVWTKDGIEHEQLQLVVDSIVSSKTVRPGGRKKANKPDYQREMAGYSQLLGDNDF